MFKVLIRVFWNVNCYFSLKVAFVSPAKEIRAASLRALRHLLQTPEQAKIVIKQRMDIFVSRCVLNFNS